MNIVTFFYYSFAKKKKGGLFLSHLLVIFGIDHPRN